MSKLNIACLLSPMADTEGPMDIVGGNVLTGPKKIMGKYGEVGLEAAITYGEENPDQIHLDVLSVGPSKELKNLQQQAVAMIQPKKFPGGLGVHALEMEDIDNHDAFGVAEALVGMVKGLENAPNMIFVGRESWDYSHGIVGPALAQQLGMPYYSGVNEIKLNDDMASVTATFIEGNDKLVYNIALPAVFGTTDWLNGKDSARFTSLKGVMAAKKFKRNTVSGAAGASRTAINGIEPVKSERKNRVLEGGEGPDMARQALDILVKEDKVLTLGGGGADSGSSSAASASFSDADAGSLNLSGDVVVVADHAAGAVRLSTHQTMSQARKVADALGKQVSLLVFTDDASKVTDAGGSGADRVVAVTDGSFKHATLEAIVAALGTLLPSAPAAFVTVANDMGRDLAAFMASAWGAGLLQDAVSVEVDGGKVKGNRVVSNARFVTSESVLTDGVQVLSIRPTAFDPSSDDRAVSYASVSVAASGLKASLNEVVAGEETKGIPLNEAKVIVSGGRGMKAAENFANLETLAGQLGGTIGASRAVTDLEWVPHNLQIGQTGTMVAPDVYFAVGISGAIQHLTGMLSSKYIVAINSDADAPIHKHADLSIIDKWENVVPTLIEGSKG